MGSQNLEPIAIVGSACRFPGGVNSPSALWKLLEDPKDVCTDIPSDRFDTTGFYHPDGKHHGATNVRKSYLLQEDLRLFDTAFFNISPNEADSMDPQQRILLETVYEALEAGGHTMESLRGSDTAVFTGTMGVDYNDTGIRDLNTVPTYFATGVNRAIISNRVSYFFDWHGPSMTIDTACSSSLIAVHQAVKALRTGESRVALACGTQVILNPEMYVIESKLKMLSPTGRSRMWDADADGYARGEGMAAIVLKRLSDAIADGDHIECLIRHTGSNQDGYSNGITVPSTEAQAALIRQTYAQAGLDPERCAEDSPQFFEAHGTGTKAGDPKEAAAIYQSFGRHKSAGDTPLYVGSIKTVIGHLEGSAGLAGLLKASGSIQNGVIAPNLLFQRLNPDIEPFYKGLQVPTEVIPWPQLPAGVPRRASVNSFGFGGSNAHAILEEYRGPSGQSEGTSGSQDGAIFTPFVFSAFSESSLVAQLRATADYLRTQQEKVNAKDLAWTLQSRRSQFPTKLALSALNIEELVSKIDAKLAPLAQNPNIAIGTKASSKAASAGPKILGVFTGQGAQWASMGAELIRSSAFVAKRIDELEQSLAALPASDRPQWSLKAEIMANSDTSRIGEAALSQPLCTAIQVVLVDLLQSAGISFSAVVGHSSGEIAAAYAAGFFSANDAVRIAYYRGLHARLAGNASTGQSGAMIAVGTSWEDAQDLISLRAFKGRLAVAAHNSAASVTLSGDADAVEHAKRVFDDEKKFARVLKVDTAYHSHHMLPCGDPYISSLQSCGIQINKTQKDNSCAWFSSVTPSSQGMEPIDALKDTYWRDNMTNAVLFADAVKNAVASDEQLSLVLEVGPHPALKGPATQNIADVRPSPIPYSGVLSRGANDVNAFSDALGFVWTHFGSQHVDFQSYTKLISDGERQPKLVVGLPSYQWNHARLHWNESRRSKRLRGRKQAAHEILGTILPESTPQDLRWSNILKVSEMPWMEGHQLQGQTVFPAAGYIAMALEASKFLAADKEVKVFEVNDLAIPRAVTFEEGDTSGVETLVTLTDIRQHQNQYLAANFSCYSLPVLSSGSEQEMELIATATVKIILGTPSVESLMAPPAEDYNLFPIDADRFYTTLEGLGYGYSGPFKTFSSMQRRLDYATGQVATYVYSEDDTSPYLFHPSTLDVAFHAAMLAYSSPGDERLWSLHVPTGIRSVRVNPALCSLLPATGTRLPVRASIDGTSTSFSGYVDLLSEDGEYSAVQIEDLSIKTFAPATQADDRVLFTHTKLDIAGPDGAAVAEGVRPTALEKELAHACERMAYFYVRKWNSELSDDEWANGQPHYKYLHDWVKRTLDLAKKGQHPTLQRKWANDTAEEINALMDQYPDNLDVKMIRTVGEKIPPAVRNETTILEHLLQDNMLDDFYKLGSGFQRYNQFLASMMKQITHRYPHTKILEIGAGTGGATKYVLKAMGDKMASYTYTDISLGFFGKAAEIFKEYSDKMTFKVLDVEKSPAAQGYEQHSYDIVIASNVLHATESLHTTLVNTRKLLKPGGYLLLLEITNNNPIRTGLIWGTFAGWWLGVEDGRRWAPTISPGQWHSALRKAGFAGVDAVTPEIDTVAWPFSIMASQAVDDRVTFLRQPLSSLSPPIHIESLVILGNQSLQTARLAEELADNLRRFCGELTILDSLPTDEESLDLAPQSTFINLVDIDSPIFKDITSEGMGGLQRMFELAKHVLWITSGALIEEPYHMSSITFSRVVRRESGHINLAHLDVSDLQQSDVPKAISKHLLQLVALDEWETPAIGADGQEDQQRILWSKESEAFLENGTLLLPRLVNNVEQNARLNSARRTIYKEVPIRSPTVTLIPPSATSPPSLAEPTSLVPRRSDNLLWVDSSSLMALNVASDSYLFLAVSKEDATGRPLLLLSTTNSVAMNPVATLEAPLDAKTYAKNPSESSTRLLVTAASEILASSLIDRLSPGSSVLVHCSNKDRLLAAALSRRASPAAVTFTFTFDADDKSVTENSAWVPLSGRASNYGIRKAMPSAKPTHFLDLTAGTGLGLRISQLLPSTCHHIEISSLVRNESTVASSCDPDTLANRLRETCLGDELTSALAGEQGELKDLLIAADHLDTSATYHATSAVFWPSTGLVKVGVSSIDSTGLFSRDKTYLLVGLTGKIGQSIAKWLVANGAGCVCLMSRNPNIEPAWIESFQGTGGDVKIYSMDSTDITSVETVMNEIRATCPPIGGVAHGSMVLHDSLFSKMTVEDMQTVLAPKIDGAIYLDQLFYDDDLDFFVLFSSAACVVGNLGQANYAAANGYLNSLSRQRRRRGVAGSTFDIGQVAGVGYIESAGQIVMDQLSALGLQRLSEADLQQVFAETIRAGRPDPKDAETTPFAVVTSGIRNFSEDENIKGPWFTNPFFSHCVIDAKVAELESDSSDKKSNIPAARQLVKATSREQALDILKECFATKLRVILQLGSQDIDYDAPLVELGIDSLVAVEVRSWFLKEVRVDIPVLKVVGGASLAELCDRAVDKLPEELLVSVGKQGESQPPGSSAQPQPVAPKPKPLPVPSFVVDSNGPPSEVSVSPAGTPLLSAGPASYSATEASTRSGSPSEATRLSQKVSSKLQSYFPPPPEPAVERKRPVKRFIKSVPISLGQSRFWFLQQLLDDQRTHNVAYYYHIKGNLDVGDMERAVRLVASRHEALRTCFVQDETDASQAYQKVLPSSPVRLICKKIDSEDDVASEYQSLRAHDLDMASGELLKLVLLTLSPSSHFLLMYHHHIIMDGISLQVFLSDLEKAYKGESLGPAPKQYPDFSKAQRQAFENGEMKKELAFWRRIFPDGEQPPVLPLLPMARTNARVPMAKFDTHQVQARVDAALAAKVRTVAKQQRSTPFHLYLAAFKALLFCFTDADELTIGVADGARHDSGLMGSIGFFLNLLTLRFRRQDNQPFTEAIAEARKISHAALENSRVPFDVLLSELNVARSSTHSPFFQAFIDYRQGHQEEQNWGNCQMRMSEEVHTGKTAYDITVDVTETDAAAFIFFRGQKSIYDQEATQLLCDTYVHFLEVLTSEPSLAMSAIPRFSEKQLAEAVQVGRGPKLVSDWPETLPLRIDQVARENPDKVALMDGTGKALTYASMISRIHSIAEALQEAGVGPGLRVLVFQQATSDWPCSMLAIMRLGAIYVPLDLRNPLPRLAAVAQDCEPTAILADASTLDDASQLGVPSARLIDVSLVKTNPSKEVSNDSRAHWTAAILYTSGSTGTPKGIMVTHEGLRNEIEGYTKTWKLGPERVLQQSAFTFNHSSDQIYTGLVNGGMVYVVPWDKRGNALEITKIIQEQGITYTKATPSEYSLWMLYGRESLKLATSWRCAFGGGESLTTTVTQQFADLDLPQLHFFNSYGPTEISISSTKMEIPYRDREALERVGRIPCGYSLPGYYMYAVDDELRPLPAGMPGQLCIGGTGVSLGYLKNQELTDKHFLPNPFATEEDIANGWTRMYLTGDIGHMNQDGTMVFHSRMAGDTQVKIRGLRIELSDIESNIVAASQGALREAVVTLREGDPEFLVAHVVFVPECTIADKETFLQQLLHNLPVPQYMIPVVAIPIDELPLTNHSKVDRKAVKSLPLPQRVGRPDASDDAELTETMIQLKGLWRGVLGKAIDQLGFDITPSTSFFLVGGNSLLIIRLQSEIRKRFRAAVPLVDLLGANTLGEMAQKVEETISVKTIDWEYDTRPPTVSSSAIASAIASVPIDRARKGSTIVITGATGFLSKHLLPMLDARPDVDVIHCLAVREIERAYSSPKVIHHSGDLSSPLLGLSKEEFNELSGTADAILHMGAARSFWDSYHVLRPINVAPTSDLVKLAAPRRVPIHYISTASLFGGTTAALDGSAVSAAAHPPPTDGSSGYAATRWASERILERSAADLGVPSSIYRLCPATMRQDAPQALLDEFTHYGSIIRATPDLSGWSGRLDMLPAVLTAQWLCEALLNNEERSGSVQFRNYESLLTVTGAELAACFNQEQSGSGNLEKIPLLKWIGKIKKAGFPYFLASHEIAIEKEGSVNGTKLEMRR
ncbi:putative lovastatin nonaketide synthase protein [Trichoderma guizhouense]|uniref:Putative lovastatin nonaketide synthase protein n=1 Tax=Trichoderma guizhouense TaxID=1491466 RepID=A0A1T3CR41_9HYPO|nr:putative lovastatin nonaketide synthase protein [Trichoderma guizhouense]